MQRTEGLAQTPAPDAREKGWRKGLRQTLARGAGTEVSIPVLLGHIEKTIDFLYENQCFSPGQMEANEYVQ